ncbi:MAG: signal recognition particle-docking protein FtsY, partial [Deltaproteobacteria bacterium]|nr:signal recognition particle-docking protein FtsY [Deltaproteobacteria bacterium]
MWIVLARGLEIRIKCLMVFELTLLGILAIIIAVVFFVVIGSQKKKAGRAEPAVEPVAVEPVAEVAPIPPAVPPLSKKLDRTRGALFGRLSGFLGRTSGSFSAAEWEQIEEILLEADVGISVTTQLLNQVKSEQAGTVPIRSIVKKECLALLLSAQNGGIKDAKPRVISIVGVNGVGKTTTIGKLASRFRAEGKTVLLGAADTFRAAASSQLKTWAERTESQFVGGRENGDPGAVAFDAVSAAKARGIDIVLLDTAGRLHTKSNLMDELKKIHRVVKKVIPDAPHETWLVLDGTVGQNSVRQASEFRQLLGVTGVIVTKLDGTAKGGAMFSITKELDLPILY